MPQAAAGPHASLDKPTILAVGRLHRQKGLDVLLDAFARLDAREWQIVLLGEGVERERLERQAQALGVADRVRFVGPVADPAPYYRAAQIFVLPSRHEGTPNALMEAMSFGLPAIVSDGSQGPLDLVSDGVTGLVIPVEDATALSAALRRLMDDQGLRARLSAGARAQMAALSARDDAFARWDAAVGFSMQAAAP
jgi:glycosyltransferase involved in cell wall biosynthesis